jgi:hypothetical protein
VMPASWRYASVSAELPPGAALDTAADAAPLELRCAASGWETVIKCLLLVNTTRGRTP